ncbi:peptidyl-prolyl cis-trans isomerase FKBP5-like [Dreissena polymorpha]|uniref:peptidylprolyl isomerase n=1 Tax=Dreissena polymorpha TaxID=45954 RepID=A0A9D4N9B1_DREPO|nr:peptidyl-prolyl cis-trans isomerase FKBP5-like [Dreissena polymorpha]KAH3890318.1 hypothetical protein DPMN_014394 [Dreissena polymorpha]
MNPYYEDTRGRDMKEGDVMDITQEGKGGVMKKLVKAGFKDESFPSFGDRVTFTYDAYIGTEINQDQKFDSTADEGKMFSYESLKGKIIRGLEMGVLTMEKGEHAIFTIQPEYAFGEAGIPGKPGKAVVTFDTKVIDIECPDFSNEQDKSIVKKIITHGVGFNQANFGCKVTIDIKCECNGHVYYDWEKKTFLLGEGTAKGTDVPKVVEEYLDTWKPKEKSHLKVKSKHAYGEAGWPEQNIPPNQDLDFVVTMGDFERVLEWWESTFEQKLNRCDEFRTKGNNYFKKKEYALATRFYEELIELAENEMCMTGKDEERRVKFLTCGHLNLAYVYLKQPELCKSDEVIKCCEEALKLDPKNPKAFYRRGMAKYERNPEDAEKDFRRVLKLKPKNKDAEQMIQKCQEGKKDAKRSEKTLYTRMAGGVKANGDSDKQSR